MSWPPVLEFLKTFETEPEIFGGAPEIWHSEQTLMFTRPELANYENPFVVLAKLNYNPESFAEGFKGWEPIVTYGEEQEHGILAYSVGKDVEHKNRLTLVEAYESEKYLMEVHMKSAPLARKLDEEDELRAADPDVVFLKHVAGYWHK